MGLAGSPHSVPPAERPKLIGKTEPRLFTEPLRPLTRETTRGFEVIEFAELIGEPLLPWQEWCAKHALELLPDGSFRFRVVLVLVARQNGKSSLKRVISLWRLFMDGARLVVGAAQTTDLALEQMKCCLQTIQMCPDLAREFDKEVASNGRNQLLLLNGARYKITAANDRAGRGLSVDELTFDELRTQRDWKAWSALSKTTMARPRAQTWAMSNAGDDESVVLNQLRDAALSGRDESIGLFEWSGEDGCELGDTEAWCAANPALGDLISEAAIRSAMMTDPPGVFRTEVLCQRVEQLNEAINLAAWKACADASATLAANTAARKRLAACFDIAPDGKHATLVAAAQLSDGRVRVEVVAAWADTKAALAGLPETLGRLKARTVAWYPSGPGGGFAPVLRPRPESLELTGTKVAEACQTLADITQARKVVHGDEMLLNAQVAGAQKLATGDGWRFTRKGGGHLGHVDAAYAAAGAAYAALTMEPEARPRIRVLGA